MPEAMSPSSPCVSPSPSRARRLRAAATRKKLFDTAHQIDPLTSINSQLCMLTSTIDSLVHMLYGRYFVEPHGTVLNKHAPVFQPTPISEERPPSPDERQTHEAGVKVNVIQERLQLPSKTAGVVEQEHIIKCAGCWEALPFSQYCSVSHLCMPCAAYSFSAIGTGPFWSAVDILEQGSAKSLEFYDSGQTMVVSTVCGHQDLVVDVPQRSLRAVLEKARAYKIPVTSHLDKKFSQSQQACPVSPQASARVPDREDPSADLDENTPDFSWLQLPPIVDLTVDQFVERFGANAGPALTRVDFLEVADAAKAAFTLPAGATENERLFTRAQVRKLVEVVNAGCTEILKSKIDVETHEPKVT